MDGFAKHLVAVNFVVVFLIMHLINLQFISDMVVLAHEKLCIIVDYKFMT